MSYGDRVDAFLGRTEEVFHLMFLGQLLPIIVTLLTSQRSIGY